MHMGSRPLLGALFLMQSGFASAQGFTCPAPQSAMLEIELMFGRRVFPMG